MFKSSVALLAATLLLVLPASLLAQNSQQSSSPDKLQSRQVIASASGNSVRFVALGELIQMRLEVIGSSGEVLFDSNFKTGNVIDWSLSDTQGQQLADGSYICVVSVKDASGQLTRRQASAIFREHLVSLRQPDRSVVTAAQVQAAGAGTDDDVSMTIVAPEPSTASAIVGHDGRVAHLVSGLGGLTISSGDFFANQLLEQMRLTPEGNLGIGVTNPQARLDVDGLIRSSQGIVFPDGTVQFSAASKTLGAKSSRADQKPASDQEIQPQASGIGTQNFITKWTDSVGTLGDSTIFESASGNVGIGTSSPAKRLHVSGGQIALDNQRFLYSRRTNGQFQEAFGIDSNNDIVFNRNSLVNGVDADAPKASSGLILGAGAGRFVHVRNSSNVTMLSLVEATGNVGIGVSSPAARLHIAGASSASAAPIAILDSTGLQVPLSFRINGTERARIRSDDSGNLTFATLNGGSNNLHFRAGDDTTSDMFIQSSTGRVGIGTTAPVSRLDVTDLAGQIRFGRSATDTGGFLVSTNSSEGILSGGAGWNGSAWVSGAAQSEASMTSMTSGEIKFFTNTGLTPGSTFAPTERMRINSRGEVGIGTPPQNLLDVKGAGTHTGGVINQTEVVARFQEDSGVKHTGVSIDARAGRNPILYLAEQGAAKWALFSDTSVGNRLKIRSLFSDGTFRTDLTIKAAGEFEQTSVGIGTTSPTNVLHVENNALIPFTGPAPPEHVVRIQNAHPDHPETPCLPGENPPCGPPGDFDYFPKVLLLQLGDVRTPGNRNNFISFRNKDGDSVGSIQGNGNGGVELGGPGSDYAEWLPRLKPAEEIQSGEIVGLHAGRVSKQTRGATKVMAVSTGAIVAGNDPGEKARNGYKLVAFIGQVMVRVRGKVQAGDFIVASGLDDGVGVAVPAESISSEQFAQAVGQAWEASSDPGVKAVRTAVGLIQGDPTVSRQLESSRRQDAELSALKSESAASEKQITELKTENAALRRQNASLDARLSALESQMAGESSAHRSSVRLKRRASGGGGM